jgi:hypothetical protein
MGNSVVKKVYIYAQTHLASLLTLYLSNVIPKRIIKNVLIDVQRLSSKHVFVS